MKTRNNAIQKTVSAVAFGVVLTAGVFLSACAGGKPVLQQYATPFEIHTALQDEYLSCMFHMGYSPDPSDEVLGVAELSRPESVSLEWKGSAGRYTVEISENKDLSASRTYHTSERKLDVYNLKIATEYYWRVRAENGKTSDVGKFTVGGEGPRNLFVDGVTNVRDLGGWEIDGGRVKQGLLYRGARLNRSYAYGQESTYTEPDEVIPEITEEGCRVFTEELGIRTEIDFRLDHRNGYPAGVPLESVVDGVRYIALPMNGNASTGDNAVQIKALMEHLADRNTYPVYVHCNIGTDRTGMVCYLIGALCGISEEDLLKDYLFSNFGNIGEAKAPGSSKNAFIGLNDYSGETLRQRAESYFSSIGVERSVYEAVRSILTEE